MHLIAIARPTPPARLHEPSLHEPRLREPRPHERGYILLTLLLAMALLIIVAGTAASGIAFSIRRDREEELIHRGVQYTRAIREFTKKTGRYPMRLEELDNTDGRRFLRKHYKDPITGKDFKLVHMVDVQISGSSPVAGVAGLNSDGTGGTSAQASNFGTAGTPPKPDPSADPQSPPVPPDRETGLGSTTTASSNSSSSGPPITGGLIVGVVSSSRDLTIREFNRKKHYNEWRFYYDTSFDQYALINAPTFRPNFQPTAVPPGTSRDNASQPVNAPAPSGSQ
jgi:type II secretory pathway pseudopilin PulG